jgi:hypothetical protein
MSNTPPEASLYDRFQTFVLGTLGFAAFGLLLLVLLFFRGCFAGDEGKMSAEAEARQAKLDIVHTEQAAEMEKLGLSGNEDAKAVEAALKAVAARPEGAKSEVVVLGSPTAMAKMQSDSAEADTTEAPEKTEEKTDK